MKTRVIISAILLTFPVVIAAQRYVPDDDIYYSPKDKKEIPEKKKQEVPTVKKMTDVDIDQSDFSTEGDFDVDAYNRRYNPSEETSDSDNTELKQSKRPFPSKSGNTVNNYYINGENSGGLEYGERIRRFHNPEVGLYVVDPEYNTLYLIDNGGLFPYSNNINIVNNSLRSPYYNTPWGWNMSFNNCWSQYYNPWNYNNPWYWNSSYYPYYPPYYAPYPPYRPYPHPYPYPVSRPVGNYGSRYTPGGSVGTGGRTDGGSRYRDTRPSARPASGGSYYNDRMPTAGSGSYGGRTSSGSSNKGSSTSGGSYIRPSNSSSYHPSTPASGGGSIGTRTPAGSVGGRSVGGRGSR